jgi:hypothetical protein
MASCHGARSIRRPRRTAALTRPVATGRTGMCVRRCGSRDGSRGAHGPRPGRELAYTTVLTVMEAVLQGLRATRNGTARAYAGHTDTTGPATTTSWRRTAIGADPDVRNPTSGRRPWAAWKFRGHRAGRHVHAAGARCPAVAGSLPSALGATADRRAIGAIRAASQVLASPTRRTLDVYARNR